MLFTIIEFIAGGVLLCLLARWKSWEGGEFVRLLLPHCPALKTWQRILTLLAISIVAATCLIDPLIPGTARLTGEGFASAFRLRDAARKPFRARGSTGPPWSSGR